MRGEIRTGPIGQERGWREQVIKLLLWERVRGQPNITGIGWTPARRIQDELQQDMITTIDFGRRLALRITAGGARAGYISGRGGAIGKKTRGSRPGGSSR